MKTCEHCSKDFNNGIALYYHRKYCNTVLSIDDCVGPKTKKKWLIGKHGHKCQDCGIETWKGKPAPIQMDHTDGNPDNNEESNLRLLCANCHAMTETYGSRNRGKPENSRTIYRNTRNRNKSG